MEMDFGSAIVGAVSIFIFILPIILMNRNKKNKTKNLLSSLQNIASQYQSEIDKYETFNSFAIGIDSYHKQAYFYKDRKGQSLRYHVDLHQIKECRPVIINRTIKNGKKSSKVIDIVALNMIPKSDTKTITLEFYNADDGVQLNGEIKATEKWSEIITQQLVVK